MEAAEEPHGVKLRALGIEGLYVVASPVHGDDRGFFREWYKGADFARDGLDFRVEQANLARSTRNVVRGLHYTLAPEGQRKLVTCAEGSFDDVIVDVRVGSPTFGRVEVVSLADDAGLSVLVPGGAAHGYCATSASAVITYLLSSPFNAPLEREINPFDRALAIPWPLEGDAIVSDKDAAAPTLEERRAAGELPHYVVTS